MHAIIECYSCGETVGDQFVSLMGMGEDSPVQWRDNYKGVYRGHNYCKKCGFPKESVPITSMKKINCCDKIIVRTPDGKEYEKSIGLSSAKPTTEAWVNLDMLKPKEHEKELWNCHICHIDFFEENFGKVNIDIKDRESAFAFKLNKDTYIARVTFYGDKNAKYKITLENEILNDKITFKSNPEYHW